MHALGKRTGLDMWPHRLRSERGSQLCNEYGWDLAKVMRFFGWESFKVARRYVHASLSDMKASMPQIEYDITLPTR